MNFYFLLKTVTVLLLAIVFFRDIPCEFCGENMAVVKTNSGFYACERCYTIYWRIYREERAKGDLKYLERMLP